MRQAEALPAGQAAPSAPAPATGARTATLLLVSALTVMAGATISPSLPALQEHFADVERAALLTRLVLTIPALFIALCATPVGTLADRFGRRPLLIGSVVLYAVAGSSGLVLASLPGILVGRALLGVAVAGTMTTVTALVGDYYTGAARDRFMGLQASFMSLGGLVFLTGGGLLAELHWRAPFAIYGLAVLLLPAAIAFIGEPPRQHGSGAAAGQPAEPAPWLAIGSVLAAAVLTFVAFYVIPTQLPFYLRVIGIGAPSLAGVALGASTLVMGVTSLFYGRLRARVGLPGAFMLGFGLMAGGYGFVAVAESYTAILVGMAVAGLGMGTAMPSLGTSAITLAPAALRGRIAGGLTASVFLGQFISPLVNQPWVDAFGYPAAFQGASVLLAALAVVAGTIATVRRRTTLAARRAGAAA